VVNPTGGQIGEGDGIGVAVFLTFFFFFTGFLVGFLVVVELELILGLALAGLADTAGFGVAVLLGFAVGFGVGVTAYELVVSNVVATKIETNNLTFIAYST
jgi:hypothetical protein